MKKTLVLLSLVLAAAAHSVAASWQEQGIIYLKASPYAKVYNIPIHAVKMSEGFWSPRMKVNVERSIPTLLQELEEHGAIDNFRRISGRKHVPRQGMFYSDSDLYKWMEAAAYVVAGEDRPKLKITLEAIIDDVVAAQEPAGYLHTYYREEHLPIRFVEMYRSHELYCHGHMFQAAIAHYRATGSRKFLDCAIRAASFWVENFGPEKRPAHVGHPESEMAFVEMYRTTGDRRYLEFAAYLLHGDDRYPLPPDVQKDDEYRVGFFGKPITTRTYLEKHAVEAMYAVSGATDYYAETGDPAYGKTIQTLWQDLVDRKLYITGGVGARADGEMIGDAYELPNADAYSESCAAIGNMMWNWRLLAVSGSARFTDMLEQALYNTVNSGMSLSGTSYCYRNPLEFKGAGIQNLDNRNLRNPWYSTTCCPPNLERAIASIPGYLYGAAKDGLYVHLFHNSQLNWQLEDGTPVRLEQKTDYPWDGVVAVTVTPEKPAEFTLHVRVPGWSTVTVISVNGTTVKGRVSPGEYFEIRRLWQSGDHVLMSLDMRPQVLAANPRIAENTGRAAIRRGPLVYCLEGLDQKDLGSIFDAFLMLGPEPWKGFTPERRPDLLGGVVVLKYKGLASVRGTGEEPLYQSFEAARKRNMRPVELTLIPYYAFANREETPMRVWIPFASGR